MDDIYVENFLKWSGYYHDMSLNTDNQSRAREWFHALRLLCQNKPECLTDYRIQEAVIDMASFIKVTVAYITDFLTLCEQYFEIDIMLEIFDKHPLMQDYYMGNHPTIKSYISLVG